MIIKQLGHWARRYGMPIAIAYLAIAALLWRFQERLIFHPAETLKHTPSLYQLPYREVWLPVPNNAEQPEKIHGWWIPAKDPQAPVLLYFHHNAANIGANVSQAFAFHRLGYSIFLMDYRGFGRSTGDFPHERQLYEDAEIAWNYLTQTRKIPPNRILIYGHSISSAVAIDLAVKRPEAAGLIVHNALTSLREMTKRFGLFYLFPVDFILRQEFNSIEKIKTLQIPVLFIHGLRDPQIPAKMSQQLYQAAPTPKQLFLIPDAGHDNNLNEADLQKIAKIVETLFSNKNINSNP